MLKKLSLFAATAALSSTVFAAPPAAHEGRDTSRVPCEERTLPCHAERPEFVPKQLTRAQALARASAAFDRADKDKNGILSQDELRNARPHWDRQGLKKEPADIGRRHSSREDLDRDHGSRDKPPY